MNQTPLNIAENLLLEPTGITDANIMTLLDQMMVRSIDFADLYFQSVQEESWVLEDGLIKEGSFDIERGVGVRAISGEKTGFAYSEEIELAALKEAVLASASIAKAGQQGKVKVLTSHQPPRFYPVVNPLPTLDEAQKIELLKTAEKFARAEDSRVAQVIVSLSGLYETILIVNTEGLKTADVRPLVRFNVSVIVEDNGKRERGFAGGGGRHGYEFYLKNDMAAKYAKEAVRQAVVNLKARSAPAGMMPVVLGPGWPGVLLHEAIGHGLEGDFNRKGTSVFSNRIGERVAADICTIVDDGTLSGRRGSLNIDDEGTPSSCTVLIENGFLKGYMQDKLNAKLMGASSTGNGRRESYAYIPIPRMTNTYMLPGKHTSQEIIASVKKGLYAVNFAGGQVDITSGKFVFSMSEAYLIENGRVTHPVKGATLIGNGLDVLTKVSMVGNDMELDEGIGVCGKDGQSIPVGVGQPTLLVDNLTVGGTA